MKLDKKKLKYIEWFSAPEMHQHFKEWLSELLFIKDEHSFFEDLINSYTVPLTDPKIFSESQNIVNAISHSKTENDNLIDLIKEHKSRLQIMIDGVDQLEIEKAYTLEHGELIKQINEFKNELKALKKRLFKFLKPIIQKDKQRHLLKR